MFGRGLLLLCTRGRSLPLCLHGLRAGCGLLLHTCRWTLSRLRRRSLRALDLRRALHLRSGCFWPCCRTRRPTHAFALGLLPLLCPLRLFLYALRLLGPSGRYALRPYGLRLLLSLFLLELTRLLAAILVSLGGLSCQGRHSLLSLSVLLGACCIRLPTLLTEATSLVSTTIVFEV